MIFVALFAFQVVQAKDHVIVIRTDTIEPPLSTEVKVDNGSGTDTITVTPAPDVTDITVTVKDEYGTTVLQDRIPASPTGAYMLSIPSLSDSIIEVSDNKDVAYVIYDY